MASPLERAAQFQFPDEHPAALQAVRRRKASILQGYPDSPDPGKDGRANKVSDAFERSRRPGLTSRNNVLILLLGLLIGVCVATLLQQKRLTPPGLDLRQLDELQSNVAACAGVCDVSSSLDLVEDVRGQMQLLLGKLKAAKIEQDSSQQQVSDLQTRYTGLQYQLKEAEASSSKLGKENSALSARHTTLQGQLDSSAMKLRELQRLRIETEDLNGKLQKELHALNAEMVTTRNELIRLQRQQEQYQASGKSSETGTSTGFAAGFLAKGTEACKKQKESLTRAEAQVKSLQAKLANYRPAILAFAKMNKEAQVDNQESNLASLALKASRAIQLEVKTLQASQKDLQKQLMAKERLLEKINQKDNDCWQRYQDARNEVWKWRLQCAAATFSSLGLAGAGFQGYRRWIQRKVWRLDNRLSSMAAALASAQLGISQRVQPRPGHNTRQRRP